MSNSGKPDESKDDALAALHGLQNSDEHDEHDEHAHDPQPSADPMDDAAASSASGFVSMLAKEGSPDLSGSGGPVPRGRTDEIHMAREIEMAPRPAEPSVPPAAAVRKKAVKSVPNWYHIAVPVMFTLGSVLFLIGFWALGAVIYMAVKTPQNLHDIGYPWISGVQDLDTEVITYAQGSKIMAGAMLTCIPVAIALGIMASIMQKRIAAFNRATAK